jgi:uncharacterized protein
LIRLRGHHLICLQFFSGEGFQPEFIENLREIIKKAEAGEEVCACPGPDDICSRCPYLKAETCLYNKDADEEISKMDQAAQELLNTNAGEEIKWRDLKEKIPGIFAVWSGHYCSGCDWKRVCEKDREFSRLMKGESREQQKKAGMKQLKVNFDEIQKAMEDVSRDSFDYFFDHETGEVIAFSEEILNEVKARLYENDADEIEDDIEYIEFDEIPELPDWMEDEIELALEIIFDVRERYFRIPERRSSLAFQAKAGFAELVENPVLKEKLSAALDGKGAFRNFKDVLLDHPKERKRWHGYNAKVLKKESIQWLNSIGVEPV